MGWRPSIVRSSSCAAVHPVGTVAWGGDVILVADEGSNTLYAFRYTTRFLAENGGPGGAKQMHGANGGLRGRGRECWPEARSLMTASTDPPVIGDLRNTANGWSLPPADEVAQGTVQQLGAPGAALRREGLPRAEPPAALGAQADRPT